MCLNYNPNQVHVIYIFFLCFLYKSKKKKEGYQDQGTHIQGSDVSPASRHQQAPAGIKETCTYMFPGDGHINHGQLSCSIMPNRTLSSEEREK